MTIKYKCDTSQDYSGEWESTLTIFHHKKIIVEMTEWDECIKIEGNFEDYKETGEIDKDGIPKITMNSLYLSIQDLKDLITILRWWKDEINEPRRLELKDTLLEKKNNKKL